jgi:hypothetical protein
MFECGLLFRYATYEIEGRSEVDYISQVLKVKKPHALW